MSDSPSGACEAFLKLLPSPSEAQNLFSAILNLQKPRGLKFNPTFRARAASDGAVLAMAILLGCLVVAGAMRSRSAVAVIYLVFPISLALIALLPLLKDLSKQSLLRLGEATVGRVVYQLNSSRPFGLGGGNSSLILYAFVDRGNRVFFGQAQDYLNNIGEGAAVVVFYDPLDPRRNVLTDCCYLTVRVPRT